LRDLLAGIHINDQTATTVIRGALSREGTVDPSNRSADRIRLTTLDHEGRYVAGDVGVPLCAAPPQPVR